MKKLTKIKSAIYYRLLACFVILLGLSATNVNAQYCAAGASTNGCNTGDERITNVVFNTISNPSGCETGMYGNYTGLSTTVTQGVAYTFTMTNGGAFGGDQGTVWIDYNHNNVLNDAGESMHRR
jgi:hypothetical protein